MKLILLAIIVLSFCSCTSKNPEEGRHLQIIEHFGRNGSSCIVTVDGRLDCILEPLGHQGDILSAKLITLNTYENTLVEIYRMTFRGNGTCELFETNPHFPMSSVPILSVQAVDYHDDSKTFQNGLLQAKYGDLNGDGYDDILFFGVAEENDGKTREIIDSYRYELVWIWDKNTKTYVEDESKRVGYSRYKNYPYPNQALQPTVKTPVESGNVQGTAAEL